MNLSLPRVTSLVVVLLLVGCAGVAPEKRHSPAEIAAYQPRDFVAPITTEAVERDEYLEGIAKVDRALAASAGAEADMLTESAMWAIKLFNLDRVDRAKGLALVTRAINEMLRDPAAKSIHYQRAVLSTAHALYAAETAPQALMLLEKLTTPRQFAIAAYTVLRGADTPLARARIDAAMRAQFADWQTEPRLRALQHALSVDTRAELQLRPALVDLLAAPFREAKPVIVSFQRKDRQRFGLAMVRAADGRFVRNQDGSLFAIPHLANALTDLPGTITNGNTPQGLFTIVGAGTATNKWIGPTPYLESKVPVEASVSEFEHAPAEGAWDEARYESFLPETWRTYIPFKEAWLAGLAGRDEMLLHGTTINRDYYTGAKFYPGTPSAGCLVATETWSKADGTLQTSDQLSLIKAFTRDGLDRGYLVVVELDDQQLPVSLNEVISDVTAAEQRLAGARGVK